MTKKSQKPKGIPLESLLTDENFRHHYEILLREEPGLTDPKLKEALSVTLHSHAAHDVREKQRKGALSKDGAKESARARRESPVIYHGRELPREERDTQIFEDWEKGVRVNILANRGNLTPGRIRQIIKKAKEAPENNKVDSEP